MFGELNQGNVKYVCESNSSKIIKFFFGSFTGFILES